jgi:hypothetical protein
VGASSRPALNALTVHAGGHSPQPTAAIERQIMVARKAGARSGPESTHRQPRPREAWIGPPCSAMHAAPTGWDGPAGRAGARHCGQAHASIGCRPVTQRQRVRRAAASNVAHGPGRHFHATVNGRYSGPGELWKCVETHLKVVHFAN